MTCHHQLDALLAGSSAAAEDDWNETETAVNAFTLVHHGLNVCTNSLQYIMLLDIINNLLLYSEPTLKVCTLYTYSCTEIVYSK